ncbi:hypothetical protein [Streptomyces sp. NPDC056464]|uniref:hypothetical protein n=1 Tax=Streptomyces sp. NPDC056464 TaxID=3345828 RepID=UPI003673EA26
MDRGRDAHAQCVALAAPYGHALVERGPLGGFQLGRAKELGDLARHVESDRQFRGRGVLVAGGVLGHEVGDGRADGAPADPVFAGKGGDRPALQGDELAHTSSGSRRSERRTTGVSLTPPSSP